MSWPPVFAFPTPEGSSANDSLFATSELLGERVTGQYDNGVWTEDPVQILSVTGNVQPATLRDYSFLETTTDMPIRAGKLMRLYTEERLQVYDQLSGVAGDLLTYDGEAYRVIRVSPWQSGVMPHYRYLMVREAEK